MDRSRRKRSSGIPAVLATSISSRRRADAVGGLALPPKSLRRRSRISVLRSVHPGQGQHAAPPARARTPASRAPVISARRHRGPPWAVCRAHRKTAAPPGEAQLFEQAVEHQAVVDANLEALEPSARIRSWMTRAASMSQALEVRADGVEVALPELAVAAALRARRARPGPCDSA